ncbi:MAG TPA: imidazolonepropionase, partial [Mycobacteriales bacterium]|nr:imidazolonepropionase [Mycobacteriales bacterium]
MSGGDLVVRRIGRLTTWAQPVRTDAALMIRAGRVVWVGADRDLPGTAHDSAELDAGGAAVIPGFVDCHTHAVWAGSRRDDFVGRLSGEPYTPGGIATTVAATRAASYEDLLARTSHRLRAMAAGGTTTVEIKSGYGLTPDSELRLLEVARAAAATVGIEATTTYLGAHVVPADRDRAAYV